MALMKSWQPVEDAKRSAKLVLSVLDRADHGAPISTGQWVLANELMDRIYWDDVAKVYVPVADYV